MKLKFLFLLLCACSCTSMKLRTPREPINNPEVHQVSGKAQINKPEITRPEITRPEIRKPSPRLKEQMNITEEFFKIFNEDELPPVITTEKSSPNKSEPNKSEINKSQIKYTPTLLDKIFAITGALGICFTLLSTIYFVIQNW